MKDLKKYLQCAFEMYNEKGELFDKLDGEGDMSVWLSSPYSPQYLAIYPTLYQDAISMLGKVNTMKVIRTKNYVDDFESEDYTDEIIMHFPESSNAAQETARKLKCEYFYWIEWDVTRVMIVIDAQYEGDIWQCPNKEFYYLSLD